MSDPTLTLKKYLVLKFMEQSSFKSGKEVQSEIIDNALRTAQAIKEIETMFNFGPKTQSAGMQQPPPVYSPGGFPNPQQPQITTPYHQTMNNEAQQNEQFSNEYNNMTNHHQKISEYHRSIMEINRALMGMQQDFFQKMQTVQQQLNELQKTIL